MSAMLDSHLIGMTNSLASNFALIIAAMLFYLILLDGSLKVNSKQWAIVVGAGFGLLCVISMLFPILQSEGIAIDARFVLAMISTIYGGPLAGCTTIAIASLFRFAKGGIGFYASNPTLMSALFLGVMFLYLNISLERRLKRVLMFLLFGLGLYILQVLSGLTFLWFKPWTEVKQIILVNNLPALIIYPPTTLILGACLDYIAARHRLSELQKETMQELERVNSDIRILNSALHHELRTPIVTIQGFLGEIRQHLHENDLLIVHKDLSYIQRAADRMSALIVAITHLNKANIFNDVTSSSLKRLVEQLRIQWPSLQICDFTDAMMVCDTGTLMEILSPIIDNAYKFIPPSRNADVRLALIEEQDMMRFDVHDNGIGLNTHNQKQWFELFNKQDAATPGIGASLAIVKRIVERLHGRITIESPGIDKGCLVQIWIPIDRPGATSRGGV